MAKADHWFFNLDPRKEVLDKIWQPRNTMSKGYEDLAESMRAAAERQNAEEEAKRIAAGGEPDPKEPVVVVPQ